MTRPTLRLPRQAHPVERHGPRSARAAGSGVVPSAWVFLPESGTTFLPEDEFPPSSPFWTIYAPTPTYPPQRY